MDNMNGVLKNKTKNGGRVCLDALDFTHLKNTFVRFYFLASGQHSRRAAFRRVSVMSSHEFPDKEYSGKYMKEDTVSNQITRADDKGKYIYIYIHITMIISVIYSLVKKFHRHRFKQSVNK